jgi:alpha-galactosidase
MEFMSSLHRVLGSQAAAGQTPFAVLTDGEQIRWEEREYATDESGFSGTFEGPRGVEVRLRADIAGDAVTVSGTLVNGTRETLRGVRGLATVSIDLPVDQAEQGTLVSTWRGARFLANFFPPDDFARVDRVLIDTPQIATSLSAHGGADGRSSSEDLPFVTVAAAGRGICVAVEWSGTWMIGVKQRDSAPLTAVDLVAGVWGMDSDVPAGEELHFAPVTLIGFDRAAITGTNALRRHIRKHVTPRLGGEEVLPFTSFNSWFAFENEYDDSLLRPAVEAAARTGLEYFVVDGGWYTGGFRRGIGNWDEPDPDKFPDGFGPFAEFVGSHGMRFGTWFEPEFAHRDSAIYRARPDWFLRGPDSSAFSTPTNWQYGRRESEYLLMDFGLAEVQAYWLDKIRHAYEKWHVRWIRWDFNQQPRPHWDLTPDSGQAQSNHLRGLYAVLDAVMAEMPDLVLEQCASGGHRIDLATARRGHTYWMNDHTSQTDIVRRLQTRLNDVLPGNYANTNLCQPRHDFSEYDFLSHSAGSFGYSGRLWEASGTEQQNFADAIRRFKEFRHVLLGDFTAQVTELPWPGVRESYEWTDGASSVALEFEAADGDRNARLRFDR